MIAPNHNKKIWWQCELGHEYQSTPNTLVSNLRDFPLSKGCTYCSGRQVLAGFNDLATVSPELAEQWHPTRNRDLKPTEVNAHTHKKVWWWKLCNTNEPAHEWQATVASRHGHDCSVCRGLTVQPGVNDLKTVDPLLAADWHPTKNGDLSPTDVTRSASKKVWWRCVEGHEWQATVNARASGRGCNSCARFGFVPSKDGWLYLLRHDEMNMFQIGISNVPERRLAEHRRGGWEVIDIRGAMTGDMTYQLERDGLRALKNRGARIGKSAKKFDGYTEAWPMSSLTLHSLAELMEWIREDES